MRKINVEPQRAEPYAYFMIRVQRSSRMGAECSLSGLVERLGTGEKERFSSTDELIRIVCRWPDGLQVQPDGTRDQEG